MNPNRRPLLRAAIVAIVFTAACRRPGVPPGTGWHCAEFDDHTPGTGQVVRRSQCWRTADACRSVATQRNAEAEAGQGNGRSNYRCIDTTEAFCVTFRDRLDDRHQVQSLCAATPSDCAYFRANRFLNRPGAEPRFQDVSECGAVR